MARERLIFPSRSYGGYIFDCDGTLADSMPLHFEAWRLALCKHGACFDFTSQLFMEYAGVGHLDTVKIFNERFGDHLDPEAVVRDKENYYEQHMDKLIPLEEVVTHAREVHAAGRKVSVASGGPRDAILRTLEIIGVRDLFDVVVTRDDVAQGKPHPETFLLAAERMGVAPGDCLVLEDSEMAIEGARKAGMDWFLIPSRI